VGVFCAVTPSVYAALRVVGRFLVADDGVLGFLVVRLAPDRPSYLDTYTLGLVFKMAQQESSKDVSQKRGPENPA
jgi:hypothetical protein